MREQVLPGPPPDVFEFFADAGNLEAITPPLLRFRIVTPQPIELHAGTLIEYRLTLHGLPISWLTRIDLWDPPHRFVDMQIHGPYRLWHHTHTFTERDDGSTLMRDEVRYALPGGALAEPIRRTLVQRDLDLIFDFRRGEIARRFAVPVEQT